MHFDLKRPCNDCPFLKVGGIRLSTGRVHEIAGAMLSTQGKTFACHKTVRYDDDGEAESDWLVEQRHCAGALIFAEKQRNATQMMRIAERLRLYDPAALMADPAVVASVFDSLSEMLATCW